MKDKHITSGISYNILNIQKYTTAFQYYQIVDRNIPITALVENDLKNEEKLDIEDALEESQAIGLNTEADV